MYICIYIYIFALNKELLKDVQNDRCTFLTLCALALAQSLKSAMLTAFARRLFAGASKITFKGMCFKILCTPSL